MENGDISSKETNKWKFWVAAWLLPLNFSPKLTSFLITNDVEWRFPLHFPSFLPAAFSPCAHHFGCLYTSRIHIAVHKNFYHHRAATSLLFSLWRFIQKKKHFFISAILLPVIYFRRDKHSLLLSSWKWIYQRRNTLFPLISAVYVHRKKRQERRENPSHGHFSRQRQLDEERIMFFCMQLHFILNVSLASNVYHLQHCPVSVGDHDSSNTLLLFFPQNSLSTTTDIHRKRKKEKLRIDRDIKIDIYRKKLHI